MFTSNGTSTVVPLTSSSAWSQACSIFLCPSRLPKIHTRLPLYPYSLPLLQVLRRAQLLIRLYSIGFGLTVLALVKAVHVIRKFVRSTLAVCVTAAPVISTCTGAGIGAPWHKRFVERIGGRIRGAGHDERQDWTE